MPKHFEGETKEGKPLANWPAIYEEAAKHKKFAIVVLTEIEYITDRQRRWYKGVCLRDLVKNDENGETMDWWDTEVKAKCKGLAYLKKEGVVVELKLGDEITRVTIGRLTTTGVGIRKMTAFIDEILSQSIHLGWNISPPDPELRSLENELQ